MRTPIIGLGFLITIAGCDTEDDMVTNETAMDTAEPIRLVPEESGMFAKVGTPTWPIDGVSASNCWHEPGSGAHKPGGGVYDSDDSFALDLNCKSSSESGKSVHPIRNGTIKSVLAGSSGSTGTASLVVVEHPESITVDGVSYSSFYSAYVHMSGITGKTGDSVTTSSTLGKVSNYGAGSDHLHFGVFVGNWISSTNLSGLHSFNPSDLGGDFASYDYVTPGYIWSRWVDNSASGGSYVFSPGGTSTDLKDSSAYGTHGSMAYTTTKTGSTNDNTYEFKFNVLTPASHGYYVWVFIPRNYGTTRSATYYVTAGTSTTTSKQSAVSNFTVDQYSISDEWAKSGMSKMTISGSNYVTVKVGDATGESSKYLAADEVLLWWKADHCLGACTYASAASQNYCPQSNYYSSTGATGCTGTTTLSSGY